MSEKRFYIDDYGVINDKEYEFSVLGEDELVNIINGIVEENRRIQEKVFELMDYLEKEKGINRQEIKEWWNDRKR